MSKKRHMELGTSILKNEIVPMSTLLLFEIKHSVERIAYNRITHLVTVATPTNEHTFSVTEYVTGCKELVGVLHEKPLSTLMEQNSVYFGAACARAKTQGYSPGRTYIFEAFGDGKSIFPQLAPDFESLLGKNALPGPYYSTLFSIGSYTEYIQDYFSRMTTRDTLQPLTDFCNSLSAGSFKKFLSDLLMKRHDFWRIRA